MRRRHREHLGAEHRDEVGLDLVCRSSPAATFSRMKRFICSASGEVDMSIGSWQVTQTSWASSPSTDGG